MSFKEQWGPKLWSLLHYLAEVSNRKDLALLWITLIKDTAAIMPCNQCRIHLSNYLRTHHFMFIKNPHLMTGEQVRTKIRTDLFNLHNLVNVRLKHSSFSFEQYTDLYINNTRNDIISNIYIILNELKQLWKPVINMQIPGGVYNKWMNDINLMLALIAGGPM